MAIRTNQNEFERLKAELRQLNPETKGSDETELALLKNQVVELEETLSQALSANEFYSQAKGND